MCEERQDQYGDAESNFKLIAKLWSLYLGYTIEAKDVATMMIMLKLARVKTGGLKRIAGSISQDMQRAAENWKAKKHSKKPPSDESGKDGRPCYYYTIKVQEGE